MADVTAEPLKVPPGPLLAFWQAFRENRGAVSGLVVLGFIVFCAIFASVLAPHDPLKIYDGKGYLPPAWQEKGPTGQAGDPSFIFGDDLDGKYDRALRKIGEALGHPVRAIWQRV